MVEVHQAGGCHDEEYSAGSLFGSNLLQHSRCVCLGGSGISSPIRR